MKILCIFACIFLAASGYRVAPTYDQPKLVECGGWNGYFEVVLPSITGPQTIVTSSNFGNGDYSDNERCSVQFITEDQPINFQLTFTDFQVEAGYDCGWDSLCVRGSKYCNETLQGTVLSYSVPANSTFTLVFSSDSSIGKAGFRVIVDATPGESQEDDLYYEDLCLNQFEDSFPTPIVEPFPFTDYPDNYDNTGCDSGNKDNDYSPEDYGYEYNNYDGDNYEYNNYDGDNYEYNNYDGDNDEYNNYDGDNYEYNNYDGDNDEYKSYEDKK